jgi:4-hydroxy-tetrahydrodipicolinate reductase
MADPIRVLVSGAAGRMGETTANAVEDADDLELVGRADPSLDTSVSEFLGDADVMVDFTTPDAAPANVMEAIDAGVHAVVGSTGFDLDELRDRVTGADGDANCFVAPNFAIGAVLMIEASKLIAPHMPEAEIVELHHDQKVDAPSGTAKRTAKLIGEAGGNVHEPIHSIRLPGLVAHQEVVFGGEGQTLAIRHDSIDRTSFMPGVLLAVRNVPGLPDRFVVGLENLL